MLRLSTTIATTFKRPTEYPSMVQYYNIVATLVHIPQISTGSIEFYIKYSCTRDATYLSPPNRTTRKPPPDSVFTLTSADAKEASSPTPRTSAPTDLRNAPSPFHTLSSIYPTSTHPRVHLIDRKDTILLPPRVGM